jgi:hypothetical protein
MKMKTELERQVEASKRIKDGERQKEMDYMEVM